MSSLFLSFFESQKSPFFHLHLTKQGVEVDFSYELEGKPVSQPFDGEAEITIGNRTRRVEIEQSNTDTSLVFDFEHKFRAGEAFDMNFTLTDNNREVALSQDYKLIRFTQAAVYGGTDISDAIYGSRRGDTLGGGDGDDFIHGVLGDDKLSGGDGDDWLDGGRGNDVLNGGADDDRFVFSVLENSSSDIIADFNISDDEIWLSDSAFTRLGHSGEPASLSAGRFVSNTTGLAGDGNDRIIYEIDTGKIFFDADGTGDREAILFAKVAAGTALTADHFIAF
jgi:Ca2+-binding RTX toxin-like protein